MIRVHNRRNFRSRPARSFRLRALWCFARINSGSGAPGFSLDSAEGDQVFLSVGDASGGMTGQQTFVKFGALKNGVSVGRVQTSIGFDFVPLSRRTFGVDNPSSLAEFRLSTGQTNSPARIGPVVITEVFCGLAQVPGTGGEQFIELHNRTTLRHRSMTLSSRRTPGVYAVISASIFHSISPSRPALTYCS